MTEQKKKPKLFSKTHLRFIFVQKAPAAHGSKEKDLEIPFDWAFVAVREYLSILCVSDTLIERGVDQVVSLAHRKLCEYVKENKKCKIN